MKRGARPIRPHGDRDDERVELAVVVRREHEGARRAEGSRCRHDLAIFANMHGERHDDRREAARRRWAGLLCGRGSRGEEGHRAHPMTSKSAPSASSLSKKLLVAAADDADVADGRLALGRESRDEVAVAAAQVGNLDVGAVQRRRADDHGGLLERATRHPPADRLSSPSWCTTMSAPIWTSASVKPKPVLVHRLVHDRAALGLGERDDERLLPVGHESGVHIGLDDDGLERAAAGGRSGCRPRGCRTRRRPCGRR